MNTTPRLIRGLIVLVVALAIGAAAAVAVLFAWDAVLPPFRREDNNTLREFIPVVTAYGTCAITTSLVAVVAWLRLRPGSTSGPPGLARR